MENSNFFCVANGNKVPCHHISDGLVCPDCPDKNAVIDAKHDVVIEKKTEPKVSTGYLLYGQPYDPSSIEMISCTMNTSIGIVSGRC
jgi:hypothetical protein